MIPVHVILWGCPWTDLTPFSIPTCELVMFSPNLRPIASFLQPVESLHEKLNEASIDSEGYADQENIYFAGSLKLPSRS